MKWKTQPQPSPQAPLTAGLLPKRADVLHKLLFDLGRR